MSAYMSICIHLDMKDTVIQETQEFYGLSHHACLKLRSSEGI